MCLAKSHGMGQQQQQRAMLTGVVYANAAAQLMKMIYVSSAHQANNTADIDSASSLYHDYVSLHFYQGRRRHGTKARGGRGGRCLLGGLLVSEFVTDQLSPSLWKQGDEPWFRARPGRGRGARTHP